MSGITVNKNMNDFFTVIDTGLKAYVLGYLSNTDVNSGSNLILKSIEFTDKEKQHLETLVNLLEDTALEYILKNESGVHILEFDTSKPVTDIVKHLLDGDIHKTDNETMGSGYYIKPTFHENKTLLLDFIRGSIDRYGSLHHTCMCTLPDRYSVVVSLIDNNFVTIEGKISWFGPAAIDFLGKVYMDGIIFKSGVMSNYDIFTKMTNLWGITSHMICRMPSFNWSKTIPDARPPTKTNTSDTGFDLHLMKKIKVVGNVHYFDTGVKVEPSPGYYMELVGRSSISKTGWTLANNVGIIDAGYRGTIIAALLKTRDDTPELELPIKLVQLIPRPLVIMQAICSDDMNETSRGEGGFGSTN